ncbi:MAG: RnfABCDGE type electron transport complex subunit D [Pseudomonadota bacterium]
MALKVQLKTPQIMLWVLGALVPGIAAMTSVWGLGVLWNVAAASLFCVVLDTLITVMQQQATSGATLWQRLGWSDPDYSTLVTAWLMAICMPPYTSLGIHLLAALAAIGLAKYAYGGLGRNVFNPAMVGYAVVLISFPQGLANWPALHPELAGSALVDSLTGATPLSEFRYRGGLTVAEFETLHAAALSEQLLISGAFALGGLSMLYARIIGWRIPLGLVAGIALAALLGGDQGSSASHGGVWLHATTGGFVAAAFFVATDPVTHPRHPRDQLYFALLVGVLIYVIRGFGSFPDGIAFAILLGNCLTPLLNRRRQHTLTDSSGQESRG